MNRKAASFNLLGMLIGIAILGLFAGLMGIIIQTFDSSYDTTGFNEQDISKYQTLPNLSQDVQTSKDTIDAATVNPSWFDFLSGIFNTIITPFKFMYRSVETLFNLTDSVINDLGLYRIIGDFIITVLTILVFVGIVMIKFYMGKSK